MGVSAIFVSTLATIKLDESGAKTAQNELLKHTIQPIVAFIVLGSIIVHGLSIPLYCLGLYIHGCAQRHTSRLGTPEQCALPRSSEDTMIEKSSSEHTKEMDVVECA